MASSKEFKDFQNPEDASVDRLVDALDRAYHRPWLMMWRSFLSGVMTAVGVFVGTALIGILSVYIFQALGGISLLKPLVDDARQSVRSEVNNTINNNSNQ